MEKPADTDHPIHPLARDRWSSRAFAGRDVPEATLRRLFEAVRWAPSSRNDQPWSLIVATRADRAAHAHLVDLLTASNQRWAAAAPVLLVAVARLDHRGGHANRHAIHDVGGALAWLTVQAQAEGLAVHQLAGFDAERAASELELPERHVAITMLAIGYRGEPDDLPDDLADRERAPRSRRPQSEWVFTGRFGDRRG